jgi:glucan 1,3-beta-glucosidase
MYMPIPLLDGVFGVSSIILHITFITYFILAAYKKEACDDDPGWCFKAAVGNSLPPSFYSYDQLATTDPSQLQSIITVVGQMVPPNASSILSKAQSGAPPWKRQLSGGQPRLAAAHMRRQSPPPTVSYDGMNMTAAQRSTAKGYADGFVAAQTFATHGMSKLGFPQQYADDSIIALGPGVVEPGTEDYYRTWFGNGLEDGQRIVVAAIKP